MGGLEVMRALNDHNLKTRHPLEVVIWVNEEGHHFEKGVFGSAAAAGLLDSRILERRDDEGLTLADWLRRYGQDPARFAEARIRQGAVAGYVELHIEQGATLDEAHVPIGVVQGIVGLHWWTCIANGVANHAGTTPMTRRHDALAAAARAVLAVRDSVDAEPGRQVGTVGAMKVEPGARNVIPGRVEFSIDLRDLDSDKINRIWTRLQQRFKEIAHEESVTIECVSSSADEPAPTDPLFQRAIREAARSAGLATMDLPSGAGHDAQNVAHIAPIGMIFVPSRGGISHAPAEFTPWDQVANGAEVLYRTILLLDARLNGN
jgi:N-carbamoyl-L-amino-acid hydrolase